MFISTLQNPIYGFNSNNRIRSTLSPISHLTDSFVVKTDLLQTKGMDYF